MSHTGLGWKPPISGSRQRGTIRNERVFAISTSSFGLQEGLLSGDVDVQLRRVVVEQGLRRHNLPLVTFECGLENIEVNVTPFEDALDVGLKAT